MCAMKKHEKNFQKKKITKRKGQRGRDKDSSEKNEYKFQLIFLSLCHTQKKRKVQRTVTAQWTRLSYKWIKFTYLTAYTSNKRYTENYIFQ